jgi:hypothetical protein
MKTMRKIAVLAATVGTIAVAAPAQAGIGIIYYSDYAGGTQIGGGMQDDCGNTTFYGEQSDIYYYAFVSIPCGSYTGWGYGIPYYTPWGPGWPYNP